MVRVLSLLGNYIQQIFMMEPLITIVERKEETSDKREHILPKSFNREIGKNHSHSSEISMKKKSAAKRHRLLKRISPFLILGFFLVGLFPYMFITGTGSIHSVWLLLFAFIFLEVNILYADFALWNYFEGKKIFKIWMIEVPLTFLIIHFLI
jgi:hypothetical protein